MMTDSPSDTRKKYAQPHLDPLNPNRTEPTAGVSEQRRNLWDALNAYVMSHGGAVVSVPHHRELRIEIPKDSAIPTELARLGYDPRLCGSTTRIAAGAFTCVDIVEIVLPGK